MNRERHGVLSIEFRIVRRWFFQRKPCTRVSGSLNRRFTRYFPANNFQGTRYGARIRIKRESIRHVGIRVPELEFYRGEKKEKKKLDFNNAEWIFCKFFRKFVQKSSSYIETAHAAKRPSRASRPRRETVYACVRVFSSPPKLLFMSFARIYLLPKPYWARRGWIRTRAYRVCRSGEF